MITAANLMELGPLGIGIIYMIGGGITGIGSNLPKDITFLNANNKKELSMSKFNEIFSSIQIILIIVKALGGFPDTNWLAVFFPAYIMIGVEYFKMLNNKPTVTKSTDPNSQKINLPIKNNNGDLFYLLINPILEEHNLLQDYSIVFFNEVFGKPELFEYIGNIDVVSKFATDAEYIKYLCGERKEFFNELVASKGATLNTMIGVLLDTQAKAIGLVAIWDTSKTMMTTDGNLRIEFTQLPVGVIYD